MGRVQERAGPGKIPRKENEEKRQKCQENRSGRERGILFRRMRIITSEYCWGED